MQRDDLVYVGHMLDMARSVASKIRGITRWNYDDDENLRLALTHLIQTIGETARQVSPAFRRAHDEMPGDRSSVLGSRCQCCVYINNTLPANQLTYRLILVRFCILSYRFIPIHTHLRHSHGTAFRAPCIRWFVQVGNPFCSNRSYNSRIDNPSSDATVRKVNSPRW